MKYLLSGLLLVLLFFVNTNLSADKLYTWTDANGNLHITENPPPKNAKTQDVMTYQPQTEAQIQKIKAEDLREEMQSGAARKKDTQQETKKAKVTTEQQADEEVYIGREGKMVRHDEEIKEIRDQGKQIQQEYPYHRR
jgi:Domain of unknown function (DUF4124)